MVVRMGMPPTALRPGFQTVSRSGGRMGLVPAVITAASLRLRSAVLVATRW